MFFCPVIICILLNKSLARINKKIFLCVESMQNSKISAQMMV